MSGAYRIYGKQKHPNSGDHGMKRACHRCNSILLQDTSCPRCGPWMVGAEPTERRNGFPLTRLASGEWFESTCKKCGYHKCNCLKITPSEIAATVSAAMRKMEENASYPAPGIVNHDPMANVDSRFYERLKSDLDDIRAEECPTELHLSRALHGLLDRRPFLDFDIGNNELWRTLVMGEDIYDGREYTWRHDGRPVYAGIYLGDVPGARAAVPEPVNQMIERVCEDHGVGWMCSTNCPFTYTMNYREVEWEIDVRDFIGTDGEKKFEAGITDTLETITPRSGR